MSTVGAPLDYGPNGKLYDGDNHEDVIRHLGPRARRGGFHPPPAPGDNPKIVIEDLLGRIHEIHPGDVVVVAEGFHIVKPLVVDERQQEPAPGAV